MFKIDLTATKRFKVELDNGFEVTIEPLTKREDIKLEKKHNISKTSMVRGKSKKDQDKVLFPETDYFELNLERAKKTWKEWNLENEKDGSKIALTAQNIEMVFEIHWDLLAKPILDEFYKILTKEASEEEDEKKT